ncbi:MAG: hypothetical protein V8T45_00650 [Oscillospiraceae bacterium]
MPVILHFANNNLAVAVSGTTQISGYALGWMDVLVSLVLCIIFLPFLLARVFRHGAAAACPGEKSLETAAEELKGREKTSRQTKDHMVKSLDC